MAEIVNIQSINPQTFETQTYTPEDINLIPTTDVYESFDSTIDHVEYFIYDLNGSILFSNVIGYPYFKLLDNNLVIDPEADLKREGYSEGNYNTVYNFLKNRVASDPLNRYYIDQISSDRTEIRLNTTTIPNAELIASTQNFIDYRSSSSVFIDFYLDFGNNNLIIANNILLDVTTTPADPTVLIKLYEPLPTTLDIQSQCWVVESIADSVAYNININQTFDALDQNIYLKGPNTNISIKDQINNSTPYTTYSSLTTNTSTLGTGSLQYQINSILAEKGLEINIDYSDYSEFVFFSSAQTRLENFYYKVSLLEQYQYNAGFAGNGSTNTYISSSNTVWLNKINEIITGFDGYEYYLYYESGSNAWPKTNSTYPYVNASTGSVAGNNFFIAQSITASLYDSENNDRLINAIPSYLKDDANNDQYKLFVDMIGQNFDSVWVYIKDVTNKYSADNRVDYGVSKDLVADVLRDLGVKIYQNNFSTDDLYSALLGITPSGSLFNLPYTVGSLPVQTGSFLEYINTYITASSTGSLDPTFDINAETYKRIYHNLPYILKKKGTPEGLRALITSYGIPDTILRINEFGGKDKNTNTWDYWQDEYNYAWYTSGSSGLSFISTDFTLNSAWGATNNRPTSVAFRFKTNGLPYNTASIASKSLLIGNTGFKLNLRYTGSGYVSGSYSGSIIDPYYQYAVLDFIPDTLYVSTSASVYLPFYDGGWWSILVTNNGGGRYVLSAANKNYNGEDGNIIGYQASSPVTGTGTDNWAINTILSFGYKFTGSLQEIRYYTQPLTNDAFNAFVMNPSSIEQSEYLAFRAPLGGELYTSSMSIHPKITGSWISTSSFVAGNNSFEYQDSGTGSYISNTETFFYDQVSAGIQNAVSEKIQNKNIVLPYSSSDSNIPNSNVLSPFISIQQQPSISGSYTNNVDYVEVAFSPQNEINDDINDTFGYFNIGEYIGDPREIPSRNTHYPTLDALRDVYFQKYTSNYNIWDYVRLIKFFDNSLFKMIQDFVPAHTDLASGIVIKQHLLERNRYPTPQANLYTTQSVYGSGSNPSISWNNPNTFEDITITASVRGIPGMLDGQRIYTSSTQYQSFPIEQATGSSGGVVPQLNGTSSTGLYVNITQSWSGTTPSLLGNVAFTQSSQYEFFNGEFSGSVVVAENGNLNDPDCRIYLYANTIETKYKPVFYLSTQLNGNDNALNLFLDPNTSPNVGEIYLYWDSGSTGPLTTPAYSSGTGGGIGA
jgi:hypothetical protein